MKPLDNLYQEVYDFQNILIAYHKARKNKRYRMEVLKFSENLEENIINLQNDFIWSRYKQGKYRIFEVEEPKRRTIMALPFRDRVAQHAINNVIEPIVDKRFYYHSYACRTGKGMHAASETLTKWIRDLSVEGVRVYALKVDVHSYFASIDHDRLKRMFRRLFKDYRLLRLLDDIVDNGGDDGRGIPVGNLTSQLFANIYLDALDKHVKETLHARHYIRYMDDFIILSHSAAELRQQKDDIENYLNTALCLSLNPKTTIVNTAHGLDFCGYRHFKDHKRVRKRSVKRMQDTIHAYKNGEINKARLKKSYASWLGHVAHADTYGLRRWMAAQIERSTEMTTNEAEAKP